jgi:hypothetical protein
MSVRILSRDFFVSMFFKELHDRVGRHEFLVIWDTLSQRIPIHRMFYSIQEDSWVFSAPKFFIVYSYA